MRTTPRRPKRWLRPLAIEREYVGYCRMSALTTEAAVREFVIPLLSEREDAIDDIPPAAGWFERLRQGFFSAAARIRSVPLTERVAEFSRRISTFNRRQFHEVLRSAYGVDIFPREPSLLDALTNWESQNIGLIRSIPEQSLERMHGKIVNAVRTGRANREIVAELQREFDISRNRAELIARDQVGKLNGQLTQERQTSIGVGEYRWRGSLDERERDEHVAREGKTFKWSEPPWDGHPGEPIQCRCTAEAVLPLLADIEGLQYADFGATNDNAI